MDRESTIPLKLDGFEFTGLDMIACVTALKTHGFYVLGVVLILLLGGWIRIHVLDIYEDNRSLLEVSSRTQTAMAEARKILRGQGTGPLFGGEEKDGYNADDTGFALYIAAVWLFVDDLSISTVQTATVFLDLLALLFLILALSRVFNRTAALLTGLLYAIYLPVPIQIAHSNNHVLVVQFALLIVSWILLLPRNLIGQIFLTLFAAVFFLFANTVRSVFGPFSFLIGFFLFLKYGKRRGLLLGLLFVGSVLMGNLCLKVAMGNPSHQVWHSLYVGLGEFANPYGLTGLDTEGNEEAGRISPGVDMYKTTNHYMEVIKHRALVLIDENPGFYLRSLFNRTFKVLVGEQDAYFIGFGPKEQTADAIAWVLFLLGWGGIALSFVRRKWDAFLLFMGHLYFSLCIVPLLATHSAYYVAGSVLILPFVGYLLSSVRLSGRGAEEPPTPVRWESDLNLQIWMLGFVMAGILISVIGIVAFLLYAGRDASRWKSEFQNRLDKVEPHQVWADTGLPELTSDRNQTYLATPIEVIQRQYLFEVSIEVTHGRIGFDLRNENDEPLAPPTYTAGIGQNRCYVGWTPSVPGEVRLHIWEAMPRDYPDHYDLEEGAYFRESFLHYGLVDFAKFDFFPKNKLEVSSSFFPNGHETIPYRFEKERPSTNEASTIPMYWAAGAPCWTQLEFETPRQINRVVCQVPNQRIAIESPDLLLRLENQSNFRAPMTLQKEIDHEGREIRFAFSPLKVKAVRVQFDNAGNELGIAYLQDVSIPEPAEFKIEKVRLYRVPEGSTFPTSLSFISEESPVP